MSQLAVGEPVPGVEMLSMCWSPKGGSGVTVVAAAIARHRAPAREVMLVDLAGDLAATLGVDTDSPGVSDWLARPDAPPDALRSLAADVSPGVRLLTAGRDSAGEPEPARLATLVDLCALEADDVVVDAGRRPGEDPWWPAAARSIVVVRNCYLALRRVAALAPRPRTVVLVEEDGRALGRRDAAGVARGPLITVPWDPGVARAVDAGLLATRMPRALRALDRV